MKKIKIQQYNKQGNLVKEYSSITEAAYKLDVDESTIRKNLDKEKTAVGYYWKKVEQDDSIYFINVPKAKILVLDIETSPIKAFVWRLWKQNVPIDAIIADWFILTWACKWIGEDEVFSGKVTGEEALREDDKRIAQELWKYLDEADVVVAHHGDVFDLPKIRSRFLVHNLMPPSPYKQIDTKKIASKEFGFSSNKLEALARLLGHEGKSDTDLQLWIDCVSGNDRALLEMEEYNIQDIYVLENVYFSLRPYIKGHPNLDLYIDSSKPTCPSCGEEALKKVDNKYYYTQSVRYQVYRCDHCKAICRSKQGDKFENKKIVSAIPR
jgi:hypothetical protein